MSWSLEASFERAAACDSETVACCLSGSGTAVEAFYIETLPSVCLGVSDTLAVAGRSQGWGVHRGSREDDVPVAARLDFREAAEELKHHGM